MADELQTPTKESPLLVAEYGGVSLYRNRPKYVIGVEDETTYSVIYDGQPSPRMTIDSDGRRVKIDLGTGVIVEGGISDEELLAEAVDCAKDCAKELASLWRTLHESAERLREQATVLASGLTDPNEMKLDVDET